MTNQPEPRETARWVRRGTGGRWHILSEVAPRTMCGHDVPRDAERSTDGFSDCARCRKLAGLPEMA